MNLDRYRRLIFTPLLILVSLLIPSLSLATGFLPVRNFTPEDYNGGTQNWAVTQDLVGRLYLANREGLFIFDGSHWLKYTLPNYTTVRSLYYDTPNRRLYAGGSEEFGYFEPDSITGKLRYVSFLDDFHGKRPVFSEVWNIFRHDDKIWFQSDFNIFCLNHDGRITSFRMPGRISRSAVVGRHIYLGLEDGCIGLFSNNRFEKLPGTEILKGKRITGILPHTTPGALLIATYSDGLYLYDGKNTTPIVTDIDPFLRENGTFCATSDGVVYLFGTVNKGVVIKNFLTGSTNYLNKESGMQNNTVLAASFDKARNIWLCLDNGLDYALFNSAVTNLIGQSNGIGAGYSSMLMGNNVLFGTNQGLYSTPYPFPVSPKPLSLKRELQGQIWAITKAGESALVASDAGLYATSPSGLYKIEGLGGTHKALPLPQHPEYAVASTYNKFHLLHLDGGRWRDLGVIDGYGDIGAAFHIDSRGFIWLPHWRKGIYRLRLDVAKKRFTEVRLFDEKQGLPSKHNNAVCISEGKPFFSTVDGIYAFDFNRNRFFKDPTMNNLFEDYEEGVLYPLPEGDLMMMTPRGFGIARRATNGAFSKNTSFVPTIRDRLVHGYENVTQLAGNEIIVSNQEGFWALDPEYSNKEQWVPAPFVNTIYANRDSLVYMAAPDGSDKRMLKLPYSLNSLRFEFSCPEFRSKTAMEFSSFLEDYDKEWTTYSPEDYRDFTQLREGKYRLLVRARDTNSGVVQEQSFEFQISPPWYRSIWAKIFYSLLSVALFSGVYLFVRRSVNRSQMRLQMRKEKELDSLRKKSEQEALKKDFEIATLKSEQLEHDVKHKARELSSTTMNLIRKNEILNDIAAKIAKIQATPGLDANVPGMSRQLAKIQNDIAENISHDDDMKTFTENFDVVYENYTKRLMEKHPGLSQADKRICCYIKMGLSSKEIAPLINISYKSVEMARYRLRKKMNLDSSVSLTDYLSNI